MKFEWLNKIVTKIKDFYNSLTKKQKRNIVIIAVVGFILINSMINDTVSEWISALPKRIYQIFIPYGKIKWMDNFLIHHIRKFAHFVEYFVFGILVSKYYFFKNKSIPKLINSAYLILSIAFLDETIQILSGRNSLVSDMWLDLLGGIVGIIAYFTYKFYKYNKKRRVEDRSKEI